MAVRTREEILNSIRARIGDDTSDEAISLVEDVTDTLADMENKANGDGVNWRERYEQNDREWRAKYRDRFFGKTDDNNDDKADDEIKKPMTYEELFKED